jgi:hypothetical protein
VVPSAPPRKTTESGSRAGLVEFPVIESRAHVDHHEIETACAQNPRHVGRSCPAYIPIAGLPDSNKDEPIQPFCSPADADFPVTERETHS